MSEKSGKNELIYSIGAGLTAAFALTATPLGIGLAAIGGATYADRVADFTGLDFEN